MMRRSLRLDVPGLAVGLSRLDDLAGLLDLLEDGVVIEGVFGNDFCRLALERDVVRLDACRISA